MAAGSDGIANARNTKASLAERVGCGGGILLLIGACGTTEPSSNGGATGGEDAHAGQEASSTGGPVGRGGGPLGAGPTTGAGGQSGAAGGLDAGDEPDASDDVDTRDALDADHPLDRRDVRVPEGDAVAPDGATAVLLSCWRNEGLFPPLEKACTSTADCYMAAHTLDCCGSRIQVGLNVAATNAFSSAEMACGPGLCPCLMPDKAEDGRSASAAHPIIVECAEGTCRTAVP